jgi:hypothetical protein
MPALTPHVEHVAELAPNAIIERESRPRQRGVDLDELARRRRNRQPVGPDHPHAEQLARVFRKLELGRHLAGEPHDIITGELLRHPRPSEARSDIARSYLSPSCALGGRRSSRRR